MTDTAVAPLPAPEAPATLDAALRHTAEQGLAEYLKDAGWNAPIVEWLHQETGIRRVWLRLSVKIASVLLARGVSRAGGGLGSAGARSLAWAFRRIPGHALVTEALLRMDRSRMADAEFARVLEGSLDPRDAKLSEFLPWDRRIQFVTQAWLHRLADQADRQPLLELPLHAGIDQNRFLYSARRTRLLGRDAEIGRLQAFLDDPRPLAWWTAAGGAGVGKSRMALELALRNSGTWRIGLLRRDDEVDWSAWRPRGPTALLVDYAADRADALGALVHTLQARAAHGSLPHPVRVLLLVRDPEGGWNSQFLGTGTRRASLEEAGHGDPLMIPPLGDEDLWTLVVSMLPAGTVPPDRASTLEKLAELDSHRRPLFAMLAGDAIAHGRDLRGWDHAALVRDVLAREAEHWRRAGATFRDLNLLALCTMTGGLYTRQIGALNPDFFPQADGTENAGSFRPELHQAMTGQTARVAAMPLFPDVLGELFVLEHLKPRFDGDDRRCDTLRDTGWQVGHNGIFPFLSRAAQDFPAHETLASLTRPPEGTPRVLWCAAAANVIHAWGDAGRWAEALELVKEVEATEAPDSLRETLSTFQSVAVTNFLQTGGIRAHPDAARERYAWLRRLAASAPGSALLQERLAVAADNMATLPAVAGDPDGSAPFVADLRALERDHPVPEIARSLAHAAGNLVVCYGQAGRHGEAAEVYPVLTRLLAEHGDSPNVRDAFARAAGSRMLMQSRSGGEEDALACYGDLTRVAAEHPDDEMLHSALAECMAERVGGIAQVAEAELLHATLRDLWGRFPHVPAILGQWARGTAILLTRYGDEGDMHAVGRLSTVLRQLYQDHPDKREIAGRWAGALLNLVAACGERDQLDQALAYHAEAVPVVSRLPPDLAVDFHGAVEVREYQLMALCGLADRMDDARAFFRRLVRVPEATWDAMASLKNGSVTGQALRASTANNAAAVVEGFAMAERLDDAMEVHALLREMYRFAPGDEEVREKVGQSAYLLLDRCGTAHSAYARDVYEGLREMREGAGLGFARWRAQAACRVLWHLWHAGDDAALERAYVDNRTECLRHADDGTVRAHLVRAAYNLVDWWQDSCKARLFRVREQVFEISMDDMRREAAHLVIPALPARIRELADDVDAVPLLVRRALDDVRALSAAYPDDAELGDRHGDAAACLLTSLSDLHWTRLTADIERHFEGREDPAADGDETALQREIAQYFRSGLATLFDGGEEAEVLVLYREVAALSDAHPGHAGLLERRGRCAGFVLNLLVEAGLDDVRTLWSDLRRALAEHPDPTWLRRHAVGSFVGYWTWLTRTGRGDEAAAVAAELEQLAASHPGEELIAASLVLLRARADLFAQGGDWL